uniref:UV-stimulated scaffold protein A-like protein n=1 Tax=Noccaea caerulescens TaxID=107243 RepID=A0A1J3GC67_NOCCA
MEGRDDGGGEVMGLIEKATKPTAEEVDPRLLKAIKSTLRYSDSEVRLGARTLMELMKHNHSQVRYLTLLIIDELFMRSKLFRTLVIENLEQLLSLSVGFRRDLPRPAPPDIANNLRKKAIEFLEKWNLSFGLHYKELRLGHDYLKNNLKIKFPDLQANAARIHRERQEREMRAQEVLRNKFDSLRDSFGLLKDVIGETIKEIKECLEIVQWRGDDGVPLAILDEEDYEEIRCSHLRQIRLDSLKQSDKIEETSENRVVFDVLREQCKLLVTKHRISVDEGISLLMEVDVSDNRTRDSMLKEFIDIRNSILATEKRCEEAGFTISRTVEEDFWEEDDGKVRADSAKSVAPAPVTTGSQHGEANRSTKSLQSSSSEPNRSTTSESRSSKAPSTKKFGRSGDSVRDKLISEAPVMNWGSQLSSWDSTSEVRANHRGLELESHWGRVDEDAVIPADKIAELNLQATVYREERSEIPACHAPLKKGGLCQRRDLRACPFHGPIVPRDDAGNPIIEKNENQTSLTTGINEDVAMDEIASDADPNQLARQIAKQALRNIREKDKEVMKKRAKIVKDKVKEHNFSVMRDAAMASTSRSDVLDEQFNRVFAERKNKKQTFSSMRRKKTTAKDRISERLFSNRVKGTKPKQLPHGDDEKFRETSANQW